MKVFVARQPIFDRYRQLYAYKLLFRSGLKNAFQATDSDRASVKVSADSFSRFGIQRMTGGKRAFINFTRDTLVKGYATLLPKELVVVENVKLALLGNRSRLRDVLNCLLAYEQAEWETFALYAAKLKLAEAEAARVYSDALVWLGDSLPGVTTPK